MTDTVQRLERAIEAYGATRAVVAFSGGVDSAVVVALAARALGHGAVTAVTAVSPSYPAGELDAARQVAGALGVAHRTVRTHEVEREAYARNDAMRCFHCKTELYATLARLVSELGGPGTVVMAGANADDVQDFRPGLQAARQRGVRNPLLEEGIGKPIVRAIARRLGLAGTVADKPALACLSSRVAYGIRITPELLARIDRGEQAVRGLGFDVVRLRHLGDRATIEVPAENVGRLKGHPALQGLLRELRGLGWREVAVDPDGYRAGSLNALLTEGDLLRSPHRA
ncbi:MAG: ATP-dependent sacrificial sulfur transferase LarE [Actinomycetota bacterium]